MDSPQDPNSTTHPAQADLTPLNNAPAGHRLPAPGGDARGLLAAIATAPGVDMPGLLAAEPSLARPGATVRVFDHLDYRCYLREVYEHRKAQDPRFSCRFIAQKVGFRSASYFTQVLNGRSRMTPEMAMRFATFLGLSARESDYFELLVLLERARGAKERRRYLEKLASFREASPRLVPPEHFEFFAKWYHTAIRELLHMEAFDGDYKALGKRLRPQITATEARESVELLLRLGMAREIDGRILRADSRTTTTGEAVRSVQVDQFHASTLALAREAIDGIPRDERALSSLTMTLSAEARQRVEAEIVAFRRRVLAIAEADQGETAVYHLGIQLFPMTREVEA